jgi:hypothetical protein
LSFNVTIAQKTADPVLPQHTYSFKGTVQDWQNLIGILAAAQQLVEQSNAPHLQVKATEDSLQVWQQRLIAKLRPQIIADTVKTKKP